MRVARRIAWRQPHQFQQPRDLPDSRAPRQAEAVQRATQDGVNVLTWIERGVGVLEHDLRAPAERGQRDRSAPPWCRSAACRNRRPPAAASAGRASICRSRIRPPARAPRHARTVSETPSTACTAPNRRAKSGRYCRQCCSRRREVCGSTSAGGEGHAQVRRSLRRGGNGPGVPAPASICGLSHPAAANGQRGRKLQPGSGLPQIRQLARDRHQRAAPVEPRQRGEQPARIGVARAGQHRPHRPRLHHASGIEHRHPVAEPVDDAEIMADEQHRQAAPRAQIPPAGRGSAPRPSRPARWSVRRAAAIRARSPAPWRSSPVASCRRRADAGSAHHVRPAARMPDLRQQRRGARPCLGARQARDAPAVGSATCRPIVRAGLSAADGSWNTAPIRRPAGLAARVSRSWPSNAHPLRGDLRPAQQAEQRQDRGGFAGPGFPHQPERRARRSRAKYIVERPQPARSRCG